MRKTLSILFALALVLSFSLVTATPAMAQSWLDGWSHRVKITIDQTRIDDHLAGFPVLLYLSASSGLGSTDVSFIFDELGANRKKIAVTTSDGTTQCYVEIEKWDSVNEQAWLWVRVPNIASGVNTVLYLYYDNSKADNTTYAGDTGSTPAQNVWDSSFVGVWHKTDGPAQAILDSTSYANHGTKKGDNEPQDVAGKIGKAQGYDGADDYVDFGSDASLTLSGQLTVELWVKRADDTTFERFLSHSTDADTFAYEVGVDYLFPDHWRLFFNSGAAKLTVTMMGDPGDWIHVAFVYDKDVASGNMKIYENGSLVAIMDYSQPLTGHGTLRTNRQGKADGWLKSTVDEVRIYSFARSAAWIKATYHSGNDGLLTYGDEESLAQCIATATSTGTACFTPSHGVIENLTAVLPPGLPSVAFPHGMFSFKITGLTPGQTVTLSITLPAPVPVGTAWWKYRNGQWYSLPIGSDNGDKTITLTLTDGVFPGDTDNIPGQITDPGGPGNPMTVGWETSPVSKAAVLTPWIALLAAIMAVTLLVLRRRRAPPLPRGEPLA